MSDLSNSGGLVISENIRASLAVPFTVSVSFPTARSRKGPRGDQSALEPVTGWHLASIAIRLSSFSIGNFPRINSEEIKFSKLENLWTIWKLLQPKAPHQQLILTQLVLQILSHLVVFMFLLEKTCKDFSFQNRLIDFIFRIVPNTWEILQRSEPFSWLKYQSSEKKKKRWSNWNNLCVCLKPLWN